MCKTAAQQISLTSSPETSINLVAPPRFSFQLEPKRNHQLAASAAALLDREAPRGGATGFVRLWLDTTFCPKLSFLVNLNQGER